MHRDGVLAPLSPYDDETPDDESDRDRHRFEQRRLDVLAERETEHCGGHEGDRKIDDKLPRFAVMRKTRDHTGELRAVLPDDREHCARLNHDLEDLALLVVEIEQLTDNDQVAGARHRQEFGQPFDHAQNQRFKQQWNFHAISLVTAYSSNLPLDKSRCLNRKKRRPRAAVFLSLVRCVKSTHSLA